MERDGAGRDLAEVVEDIIGATGSTGTLMAESLGAGDVIASSAVFAYRIDSGDGSASGEVRDGGRLGERLLERVAANLVDCPLDAWHRDGNGDEVAVLSSVIDPDGYGESDHYRAVFGRSGTRDALSIPFGSGGETARVIVCRDSVGFSDGEVETARVLQPVLAGCLRQSRVMEQLRADPLSEQAMRDRGLTAREAQIFARLAAGATSQAVGQELGISVRTVEKHVQNIYARLGAGNRSEAISILLGNSAGAGLAAAVAVLAATSGALQVL